MKTRLLYCVIASMVGSLSAAETDDVKAAAKKLAAESNYSWTTTFEGGRFSGSTDGKAEKDGFMSLSMKRGDNSTKAVLKENKGAAQIDGEWRSLSELAESTEPGPATFLARILSVYKAPAAEAEDLAGKAKELKKEGDALAGDLTEAGAQSLLTFRGFRPGGDSPPPPKNAKGSVKFWLKDGQLAKYEYNVKGTVNFNGEDRDIDRTTTTEIKAVGTTKVEIPDEAKKKVK